MYNTCMSVGENKKFADEILAVLEEKLPFRLGVNKTFELQRLIYEICVVQGISLGSLLTAIDFDEQVKAGKGNFFYRVKKILMEMRYPSIEEGDNPHLMPLKIDASYGDCTTWNYEFRPEKIFIERDTEGYEWTQEFISNFLEADIYLIESLKDGLKKIDIKNPLELYDRRRENVFIVKAKTAFTKICPCTKDCKRCGYWILNIGFGCPMDCSYCYMQLYSNAPGMIFPSNIEDYYKAILEFDKKLTQRTRIGTGEFTDSLAFDKYTNYSGRLIPFFKQTENLVLELKTKVADIENVLMAEPNDNVVVSWSINAERMAENYEKGAAGMKRRIHAALSAVRKGYKVGFHFDPVIYYPGWEKDYQEIIGKLFSYEEIRKNTEWISLGTLRYTPGLKQIAEKRFADNSMYYHGEFIADFDGKLRYPKKQRIEIYNNMIKWIRSYNVSGWIYLCMEPLDLWKETLLDENEYEYGQRGGSTS